MKVSFLGALTSSPPVAFNLFEGLCQLPNAGGGGACPFFPWLLEVWESIFDLLSEMIVRHGHPLDEGHERFRERVQQVLVYTGSPYFASVYAAWPPPGNPGWFGQGIMGVASLGRG